jgi:hypothetical protein
MTAGFGTSAFVEVSSSLGVSNKPKKVSEDLNLKSKKILGNGNTLESSQPSARH